eukprot:TRINITY_DN22883_c0_g1_i1.p1 TRINITY_DN22883_c0_g1~~TRINITY_DN22883_c0_g1_i1.p1  ORF type:complete len:371 (-),score=57.70 TRINITY_DN22883_c0_g1_i1:168-1280(-)
MKWHAFSFIFTACFSLESFGRRLPMDEEDNCTDDINPIAPLNECIDDPNTDHAVRGFVELGYPIGLALLASEYDCKVDLRMFLLDNSASTVLEGGHCYDTQMNMASRPCHRWTEITEFAHRQAAETGCMTEFIVMNPLEVFATLQPGAGREGKKELETRLKLMRPRGATPMRRAMELVKKRFDTAYAHKVSPIVVLTTDGEPDDRKEMVTAMRSLSARHDFKMVARLTASEHNPSLYEFYSAIDKLVGFDFQVVSDYHTEAKEIDRAGNGFFSYSVFIHFMRSRGTNIRAFERIDKKMMEPIEAMRLVEYILKADRMDPPFRKLPEDFVADAEEKMKSFHCDVYDPLKQAMTKPINIERLKVFLGVEDRK